MNRYFPCPGTERIPLDAPDITDIGLLKGGIQFFPNGIPRYIDLNIAFQVLNIGKRSLTHHTLKHHTTRDGHGNWTGIHDAASLLIILLEDLLCLFFVQSFHIRRLPIAQQLLFMRCIDFTNIRRVMCHVIFGDLKRVLPCFLQCSQLLTTHLQQLIHILSLCIILICHVTPLVSY